MTPPAIADQIQTSKLDSAFGAIGESPQWVFDHFGRPAFAANETCCEFQGYESGNLPRGPVLVHAYDLDAGGRIAFIFDRLIGQEHWKVVGVVYDALTSDATEDIHSFLPAGLPASPPKLRCYEKDFYHHEIGDFQSVTAFGVWSHAGRVTFLRRSVVGKLPTTYDVVSGGDVLSAPTLSNGAVLQIGVFRNLLQLMDLHMMPNNDDFSIAPGGHHCFR